MAHRVEIKRGGGGGEEEEEELCEAAERVRGDDGIGDGDGVGVGDKRGDGSGGIEIPPGVVKPELFPDLDRIEKLAMGGTPNWGDKEIESDELTVGLEMEAKIGTDGDPGPGND